MISKSVKLILLSANALLLVACGGGSSPSINQSNPTIQQPNPVTQAEPTVRAQPKAVETINWQSARLIETENPMQNSVEIIGSELSINVSSTDISEGAHLQIYLNTDNKTETGFQFEGQAWEESGVDYLIEDGDLFKSTANNTGWNWNVNIGSIDYTLDLDTASAKIDLSLLGDICNVVKVGVMTRDEFWDISTFSPASTQMQTFEVSYCNTDAPDTVNPVITLLGANPLNFDINDTFVDPGATASDNIDGNITSRIVATSTVDTTTAGIYDVTYSVSDIAGNPADIVRVVVVNDVSPPEGIVVDGNTSDWDDIPTFSSSANAIMKVSDDEEKLYILVTSDNLGENIQVLMDTDNNAITGLDLSSQITAWLAGADYMIENNSLDKSTSNTGWSWDYGVAPIEYIKTSNTLEIAIKKSDFNSLGNEVPMGFVSRTESWNVNYILPAQAIPVYTMQFANEVNPVQANNDSVTTPNDESINIDVLDNDISLDNSLLDVDILAQPETGTAEVITDNNIRYIPDASFTGTVTFTYVISDTNGNLDTATIKVIVTEPPLNNPPIAVNDSYEVDIATQSSVLLDVLLNDSDPDGDILTLTNVVNAPSGDYSISPDNKVLFVPSQVIREIAGIPYTVSDGNGGISTALFTVNMIDSTNESPVANDDFITTFQNQSVTFNVIDNDTDPDGDIITSGVIGSGANSYGTVVSNLDGSYTYTPDEGFVGLSTHTYRISDGKTGRASGTVFITVNIPTNNAPIANNDSATTDGIRTKQIQVLTNDTDEDGDSLQIIGFTQPSNGSISLSTATATFNYTPNATFSGTDTFTYRISDGNEGVDTGTVTVTVPPNNAPDAVEDAESVDFDKTITIDVLSNDTDPDNDVLSVLSIVQPPVGIATLNANGTIFFDPQNNVGSISIGYTVTDSRGGTDFAVLTVASTDPNDGNSGYPVIVDENVATTSGSAIFIDVLDNDSDPDGDTLILDQLSGADNGTAIKINGGVRYTPNPGFLGTDFVYYGVHDGFGHNGFGTITITVSPTATQ